MQVGNYKSESDSNWRLPDVGTLLVTLPYPKIPPVLVQVGPFALRWYALMYLIGYIAGTALAKWRTRRGLWTLTSDEVDTLVGYLVGGMLVGARLTYVFVYDWPTYSAHPIEILAVWKGGLSFHGAVIGMATACAIFARRHRIPWLMVTDGVAASAPPGLFFGRLGNFINGELYGRPTTLPWAMIFPSDPSATPRHPSQLYEALGEGVMLGLFLWWLQRQLARQSEKTGIRDGYLSATFLIGYAIIRFSIEFSRQPDDQLGFVLGPFSMGQLLSILTLIAGAVILWIASRRPARPFKA